MREWNFHSRSQKLGMEFSRSSSQKMGMKFFIPVPVPKVWEWAEPFPFPNDQKSFPLTPEVGVWLKSLPLQALLQVHTFKLRWFLTRNTGTKLHMDPSWTSAWNTVLKGHKWFAPQIFKMFYQLIPKKVLMPNFDKVGVNASICFAGCIQVRRELSKKRGERGRRQCPLLVHTCPPTDS